ncbi:hypothetical protein BT69DRAFT_1317508 [Atractiella rhizophila]|nr:hypothetical protein BT69DRAFT_1317508 [Atractiella rhizophila]
MPKRKRAEIEQQQQQEEEADSQEEFTVEKVLDSRYSRSKERTEFLVQWAGYSESENSWEPFENFNDTECIFEFYDQNPKGHGFKQYSRRAKKKEKKKKKQKSSTKASQVEQASSSPDESLIKEVKKSKSKSTYQFPSQSQGAREVTEEDSSDDSVPLRQQVSGNDWKRRTVEEKQEKEPPKQVTKKKTLAQLVPESESDNDEFESMLIPPKRKGKASEAILIESPRGTSPVVETTVTQPLAPALMSQTQSARDDVMDVDVAGGGGVPESHMNLFLDVMDEGDAVNHLPPILPNETTTQLPGPPRASGSRHGSIIQVETSRQSSTAPVHSINTSARHSIGSGPVSGLGQVHDPELDAFNRSLHHDQLVRPSVVLSDLKNQRKSLMAALGALDWWRKPMNTLPDAASKGRTLLKLWWGIPDGIDALLRVKNASGNDGKGFIIADQATFELAATMDEVKRLQETPDAERWKLKEELGVEINGDIFALLWFLKSDDLVGREGSDGDNSRARAFEFSSELDGDTDFVFIHVSELDDEQKAREVLKRIEEIDNGRIRKDGYVCFFGSAKQKERVWKRIWDGGVAVTFTHLAMLNHIDQLRNFLGGVGTDRNFNSLQSLRPSWLLHPYLHPGLLVDNAVFNLQTNLTKDPWLNYHLSVPIVRSILLHALEAFLPNNSYSTVTRLDPSLSLVCPPLKYEAPPPILAPSFDWFPVGNDRINDVEDLHLYGLDPIMEEKELEENELKELQELSTLVTSFRDKYLNVRRWVVITADAESMKTTSFSIDHEEIEFFTWDRFNDLFLNGDGLAWL